MDITDPELSLSIKNEITQQDLIPDLDHVPKIKDREAIYVPRLQLSSPDVTLRSLGDLLKGLDEGVIDVEPEYQREVVWSADRMTGLIDSVMENYFIPPIILNRKMQPTLDGHKPTSTLVCVDGKQRLSSVRAFIKGFIPCHDRHGEKWYFSEIATTKAKKILSNQAREQFLLKTFISYEFHNLTPEQEEDVFARVQMGMQLNPGEKMRATSGPWQELARLFVNDFPKIYELMKNRARAKDFQLTLACFSQILEVQRSKAESRVPILKTNHTSLPRFLQNRDAVDEGIKSHLGRVWRVFTELIEQDPDTFTNAGQALQRVQTFAPVEMIAVTVLISMHHGDVRALVGDIQALRHALREKFVDLRTNPTVWKFIWELIDDVDGTRTCGDESRSPRGAAIIEPGASMAKPPQTLEARAVSDTIRERSNTNLETPLRRAQDGMIITETSGYPFDMRHVKRRRTQITPAEAEHTVDSFMDANEGSQIGSSALNDKKQYPPLQPPHKEFRQSLTTSTNMPEKTREGPLQEGGRNIHNSATDPCARNDYSSITSNNVFSQAQPLATSEARRQRIPLQSCYHMLTSSMGARQLYTSRSHLNQESQHLPLLRTSSAAGHNGIIDLTSDE